MHKRTQFSQLSTKYTDKDLDTGPSSYLVNKKRDMFQPLNERNMQGLNKKQIIQQNGSKMIPKNVLKLNPSHSRSITWPQIFMPDQEFYVSLKGNFYTICDSRNKQKFIQRKSMPESETVYFNAQKNNDRLVIVSVQKFLLKNDDGYDELWHHIDLVVWDFEEDEIERRWAIERLRDSMQLGNSQSNVQLLKRDNTDNEIQQFKCIQLVDSYKKALIVFDTIRTKQSNNHRYEIVYIDFFHNPNKSYLSLSSQYIPSSKTIIPPEQTFNFNFNKYQTKIVGRSPLQRLQSQTKVKLINSDYGDIVLLVTAEDIYELQINSRGTKNQHSIIFKPLNINRMLLQNKNTYIQTNNIANLKQSLSQQQLIIDAKYIPKSLKVLILTSHGRIMVIESEECIFTESLYQLLSPKDMLQLYNIQYFLFKNIHFLNGFLIVNVQAQRQDECNLLKQIRYEQSILDKLDERKDAIDYVSRGLVVAKLQTNTISFNKFVSLPFDLKTFSYIRIHSFPDTDQLLIQTINDQNPLMLELYKCQIISNKNSFIPFRNQHFLSSIVKELNIKSTGNTKADLIDIKSLFGKVTFGKSQRIFYLLRGNYISCYRINTTQFTNYQQSGFRKIFSTSFFQKPLKLIINPLTGQLVVLFRQFIKIFSNVFTELRLLNHINIREVKDISFSRYGEKMFFVMNDNSIHQVDSYTLRERKVIDFQGEVKQISCPSQYLLCIKSSKNTLSIYKKKNQPKYEQKTDSFIFYDRLYQITIQTNDLYYIDEAITVLLKKSGTVQIYSHVPGPQVKQNSTDDNQQLRFQILKNQHPNLLNRKNLLLQKNDSPNYLFYSSQFCTIFVGTQYGYIYQYLYPFLPIQDPSPPQFCKYQLSSTPIIHLEICADFQFLYVVSEIGQILELKFQQYLNGLKKNGVYVVSKTQNSNQNFIKYEFANRNYLMDSLATINVQVAQGIAQSYEQICFIDEKIKNDIEDVISKIKSQSNKEINKLSTQKKSTQFKFKSEFNFFTLQMKQQQKMASQKLHQMYQHNQNIKSQMIENYQKQLLQIYKQNDRLTKIMENKMKQFKNETLEIKSKLQKMREEQENLKQIQLQKLQQSYKGLDDKYNHYQEVTNQQIDENKNQLQQLKQQQMQKYTTKLLQQQKKKQKNLSQLGKIQKQIQRFKKRSIYFQNLIVETRNQIQQLAYDVNIYQQKKSSLNKQLQGKQQIIELKQTQIIAHLKKTTEMKKIKNIHQFQLQQFQTDILPVQNKISQIQTKVQQMNHQIMLQFNSKVQQNSLIQNSHTRIQKLKQKSKIATQNALNIKTKMLRFTQALTELLVADPFALDIRKKLSKVIDNFSNKKSQVFAPNYDLQREKKHSQHLIRKKNMLLKSIQREEKLQQGVIKNKNQFFRFYTDNTNLVKQYNQLFKDHNILMQQKIQLQKKTNALKQQTNKTPVKRTTSLHTIKKVSGTKLTPFQRYQQEHVQLTSLKLKEKDTTQTRMSRGQSSSSFLKSLIKDVSIAQSKYQKGNLIRDRIRTFVNPELQRQKQIQRQLFQRQKGKSSYMPALKL